LKNKKGISPLIATVLLIGFVVAIAAIVMLWGKGFIEERTAKEGALSKAKLDCTNINIKFIKIDESGHVVIENRGIVEVNAFKVKYYGGPDTLIEMYMSVKPLGRINIPTSGADRMDIIPAIKPKGVGAPLVPCSDKHKLVNI